VVLLVVVTKESSEGTTEYSEAAKLREQNAMLAKLLKTQIGRTEKLEDAIVKYVADADRLGTMNPKNLKTLRDVVTR
jgi:hypothetical protein